MNGVYWPETGTNTLGNWDYNTGYQIKALNGFDVTLTGSKIADHTVVIPQGWSLLPVLVACETPVDDMFSAFADLTIVKQVAGVHLYRPSYNINTLGNLIPGKAYFVALNEAVGIEFPACNNKSYNQQPQPAFAINTSWNDPSFSASTHSILFPSKVIASSEINSGDVIGVFDVYGVCYGMLEIASPDQSIALTAFGSDLLAGSIAGFDYGEQFQFRVFRPATQEEMILDVEFDPALPNMASFSPQGMTAAKSLKLKALGVNKFTDIQINVFPNPTTGIFNLSMSHWPEKTQIQLLDTRGQAIKLYEFNSRPDGHSQTFNLSHLRMMVYFVKIIGGGLVVVRKVVLH
jgi:hypothetical protein